jgi:hypothetical protein
VFFLKFRVVVRTHYRKFHPQLTTLLDDLQAAASGDQSFIDAIDHVKSKRADGTQKTLEYFVKKPTTDAELLGVQRRVAQQLLHIAEAIPLDKADSAAFKAFGEMCDAKVYPSQSLRDRERQLYAIMNNYRVEELGDALGVSVTADGGSRRATISRALAARFIGLERTGSSSFFFFFADARGFNLMSVPVLRFSFRLQELVTTL